MIQMASSFILLNLIILLINTYIPSTETLKSWFAVFPAASTDVYVTIVTPMLNDEPGVCVKGWQLDALSP